MIRDIEIKEMAREYGVPETTIEKDYALNLILKALYQQTDSMALKGGTGLRKAAAKRDSGINFHDIVRSEENINGYEIDIYFRIFRWGGNPLRIKFDITKTEKERIVLPLNKKQIIHPYSDDCSAFALVYSIQEIMAEKLRSLFERTRARDIYDVWYLSKNIDYSQSIDIFTVKCEFKRLTLDISHIRQRKEDFLTAWQSSLRHQLKNVPDFEPVFNDVIDLLNNVTSIKPSS